MHKAICTCQHTHGGAGVWEKEGPIKHQHPHVGEANGESQGGEGHIAPRAAYPPQQGRTI